MPQLSLTQTLILDAQARYLGGEMDELELAEEIEGLMRGEVCSPCLNPDCKHDTLSALRGVVEEEPFWLPCKPGPRRVRREEKRIEKRGVQNSRWMFDCPACGTAQVAEFKVPEPGAPFPEPEKLLAR